MRKCILICAGEYNSEDLNRIKKGSDDDDYIIAADGGIDYCNKHGIIPDCVVGDFDSADNGLYKAKELQKISPEMEIIQLKPEKDDTDTMSAIKLGLNKGFKEFHLYCCMGGRRDHSIANIVALTYLCKRGAKGYIHEGSNFFTAIMDETIELEPRNGYVSLFAMGGNATGVTLKNLKYEIDDGEIEWDFPLGCSNEFLPGKSACIQVKKGCLLIRTEEDKN